MQTEIDVKAELREGWEVVHVGNSALSAGAGILIPDDGRDRLRRRLPITQHISELVGSTLKNVYGTDPVTGTEYRFTLIQIERVLPVQDGTKFDYTAFPTGPIHPATPFDAFLIDIENGDSVAASVLVDHLTELHGEGSLIPVHLIPKAIGGTFGFLSICRWDLETNNLSLITKRVVSYFGGSRTLPNAR